jgi:glycosyltransferase involved in cell wall biosynthesis
MNVLLITGEYPPMGGGIAGYTELLREALGQADVNSIVVSRFNTLAEYVVDDWNWSLAHNIRQIADSQDIDVIHIQYQAGAFDMSPAVNLLPRMLAERPVITTFHDLRPPYLFPKAGNVRFATIKRMARWSTAAIVTNSVDQRTLGESGITADRIPLGPSLPQPDVDTVPGLSIGFFGYPSKQKGFDILIKAVSQLDLAGRPEVLIVGSLPPATGAHGYYSQQEVMQMAASSSVSVKWTGFLESQAAANALASCAIVAFPFPGGATLRSSALLAALQVGRPVVTTMPAQIHELDGLQNMSNLHLIEPGDVNAVTHKLEQGISTPQPTLPAQIPSEFAWQTIAARHAELYRSLSGKMNP